MNSKMRWIRHGLVFPVSDVDRPAWMHSHAQAPAARIRGRSVRFYFSTRQRPDAHGQQVSRLGFADFELGTSFKMVGISKKPVLALGKRGAFDEFGTYPMSTIDVGDEIWGYYGGWSRSRSVPFTVQIGLAISADGGDTFEKLGRGGPVLGLSEHEPFVISGPKIRRFGGVYFLFYIAGRSWILENGKPEPIYKIRSATSLDGIVWQKTDRDIIPSLTHDEAQASPDVFWLNGRYHMLFCRRPSTAFRIPGNSYTLGYAWSEDLQTWYRDDEVVSFSGQTGEFDAEMQAYPHYFEVDGRSFMAYLGNQFGRFGFGVAELLGFD